MSQTAIEFQNVTKQFDNAALPSVDQVSLTIEEGEFITILGSSGSGKTTLLKMVNRLYEPTGGKIFLFGEDISTVDVVKAVSYTHLDVYKRQRWFCTMSLRAPLAS